MGIAPTGKRINLTSAIFYRIVNGKEVEALQYGDMLADRIAVIDHGKIIAEGTSGELKSSVESGAGQVFQSDSMFYFTTNSAKDVG